MRAIIAAKLERFAALEPEFITSFQFVEATHGQVRFAEFPIEFSVRYLHALWICECKDRLLSVPKTLERYEGQDVLEKLRGWQAGETAPVVDFLQRKLDMQPFAEITRLLHEAEQRDGNESRRLAHGRMILLNRAYTLLAALEAIFALSEAEMIVRVQRACADLGHTPEAIDGEIALLLTPEFAFIPHHDLARRNMLVMNHIGARASSVPGDRPGERTWRVVTPELPPGPYAQIAIADYYQLTSPAHNNLLGHRFVDRPEPPMLPEVPIASSWVGLPLAVDLTNPTDSPPIA